MKGCEEGRNCDVGKCVCATGAARARFALRWRNSGPLCQRCTDLILCICAGRNNVICKGEKEVQTSSKQPEGLSRFRHVRSKRDQEKVAISDKLSRRKKCQGQRVPRDHGVNGRASQAARRRSYRLSLFFIAFPPSETSVTRLARALLDLWPSKIKAACQSDMVSWPTKAAGPRPRSIPPVQSTNLSPK